MVEEHVKQIVLLNKDGRIDEEKMALSCLFYIDRFDSNLPVIRGFFP